jgi:hypothetical protein
MEYLKFKNGRPVPDDEVFFNPDVDKAYSKEFLEMGKAFCEGLEIVCGGRTTR